MLLSLRRHGDTIIAVKGKEAKIGEAIPNDNWLTVELGFRRDHLGWESNDSGMAINSGGSIAVLLFKC